ncbi:MULTISPECIES: hypothetical protein [Stenotrophomonas]|uniref:Secreted protein n=1 Tax=Stenotrophomonas maltophilia TaxID=40324 RepID=A0AAD0FM83_STEMA|nr:MULTISPECIES: hypothetical protein [Stenotrophomonas]AUI07449.1 hypothetical protein SmaCSM2_09755 [Stenotrophomonas maltophilia]MBA2131790.1 hypothetical protein [Stenotrophomonas maltophilia]MBH1683942.1 hypothetical protein [Stenotrophomonas maltophilia]MBH1875742.1 hypothetical protein [Stenotrophomonas maltophilia]RIA32226.1 hypothetical protein DFO63_0093 [Stenotrophomonas sp. AG209]
MPTKRLALIGCLSLLAACSPQAADNAADATPKATPAVTAAPAVEAPAAVEATAKAEPATDLTSGDEELDKARAAAGCPVPGDVYDADDVRIYCAMPADVQAFLARENTCQHFAGEEPYDDERRRELEEASVKYCEGREKIFTDLVARHRGDCAVRAALIGINTRYDLDFDLDLKPCGG